MFILFLSWPHISTILMKSRCQDLTAPLCAGQISLLVDGLFIPGTLMFEGLAWPKKKKSIPSSVPSATQLYLAVVLCCCVCVCMYAFLRACWQVLLSAWLPLQWVEVWVTWHPRLPSSSSSSSVASLFISSTSPSSFLIPSSLFFFALRPSQCRDVSIPLGWWGPDIELCTDSKDPWLVRKANKALFGLLKMMMTAAIWLQPFDMKTSTEQLVLLSCQVF